jgi:hypothetical protein
VSVGVLRMKRLPHHRPISNGLLRVGIISQSGG